MKDEVLWFGKFGNKNTLGYNVRDDAEPFSCTTYEEAINIKSKVRKNKFLI